MITGSIFHLFMALTSWLQPEVRSVEPKISNGYYRGSVFMFNMFMRVSGDTAFIDFVAWDKYPRDVKTDTLYYNQQRHVWQGKYSVLTSRDDKHYIRHYEQSPLHILAPKVDLRLKSEDKLDGRKVDSRNRAMLNAYYQDFLRHHATEHERLLYYQTLYNMVDKRAEYNVFQIQFNEYRAVLERKIAAVNN